MINQGLSIVMGNNSYASVVDILQRDLRIELGEASIWSWLDELGRITGRLMIKRPIFGNWVVITPEFGSQNIIIQYSDPTVKLPLPPLLTLELHIPLTDKSNEELQFKTIWLTWSTAHPTINCLNWQNTKNTKMSHHHSIHIPIYEGEEDPRQHWFICKWMWDAADIMDENR